MVKIYHANDKGMDNFIMNMLGMFQKLGKSAKADVKYKSNKEKNSAQINNFDSILTVEDLYGNSVFSRFDYLATYYKEVTENPKEDFSME